VAKLNVLYSARTSVSLVCLWTKTEQTHLEYGTVLPSGQQRRIGEVRVDQERKEGRGKNGHSRAEGKKGRTNAKKKA
jgi:hypothetical protein